MTKSRPVPKLVPSNRFWGKALAMAAVGLIACLPVRAEELADHVRRGLSLMEQGAYMQASEEFRAALVKRPHDPDALFGLGFCLYRMTNYQEASAVYDQLVQYRPSSQLVAQARSGLGDVYLQMGMYPEAVAQYSRALATNPHWIGVRLNLGRAWLELGNHQAALHEIETVLENNPRLSEAYHLRSRARFGLGDTLLALSDLQTALSLNAHLGRDAYLQLATLQGLHGQYAEGVRVVEKVLAAGQDGEALRILGELRLSWAKMLLKQRVLGRPLAPGQHGDSDRLLAAAVEALQRAVMLEPNQVTARRQLAESYLLNGETRAAFHQAKAALRIDPSHVETAVMVSRLAMRLGLAEADKLARLLLEHRPQDPLVQRHWLLIQAAKNRQPMPLFEDLVQANRRYEAGDYHGAIALLPDMPEAMALLGRWAYAQGDYARAVRALKWATSWLADPEGSYLLSQSYERLGQVEWARAALRETLAMDRSFPGARHRYWSLLTAQ